MPYRDLARHEQIELFVNGAAIELLLQEVSRLTGYSFEVVSQIYLHKARQKGLQELALLPTFIAGMDKRSTEFIARQEAEKS